jgi:hypothetical protein
MPPGADIIQDYHPKARLSIPDHAAAYEKTGDTLRPGLIYFFSYTIFASLVSAPESSE